MYALLSLVQVFVLLFSNKLATCLLRIRKVPNSKLGPRIGHLDSEISSVSSIVQAYIDILTPLDCDHFLPYPFQFIIR